MTLTEKEIVIVYGTSAFIITFITVNCLIKILAPGVLAFSTGSLIVITFLNIITSVFASFLSLLFITGNI